MRTTRPRWGHPAPARLRVLLIIVLVLVAAPVFWAGAGFDNSQAITMLACTVAAIGYVACRRWARA